MMHISCSGTRLNHEHTYDDVLHLVYDDTGLYAPPLAKTLTMYHKCILTSRSMALLNHLVAANISCCTSDVSQA